VIRLTPERRPAPGAAGGSAGLTSNAAPVPTMRTAAARTVSPLRVALVDPGDFTPPYDAALARGLAAAGAEVRLIGQSGGNDSEAPGCHEDWFYRYSGRARSRGLPETAARLLKGLEHGIDMHRLTRALRLAAIDIVHFQWLPLPLLDHLYIMRIGAFAPTVVTMHDSLPYNGAGSVVMRLGHERSLHAADALIVHTEEARARLLANGHDAERVHVVPHGMLQPAARGTLDSPSTALVPPAADRPLQLLQFGKLKPYKGIDVLLEAVGRLPQDCRARIRLLIVGKPYMPIEPLRDLIVRYGLEAVVELRLDFVPEAEVQALFRAADALICPYRTIDASGVAMAALAEGVPLVASRVGMLGELFADGTAALLVPPGEPGALAEALSRLIIEPELLGSLHRGMLTKRAGVPSWERIGNQTMAVYERANYHWKRRQ
jgi:glycosyltransferase involved in cell wall biosynthesis